MVGSADASFELSLRWEFPVKREEGSPSVLSDLKLDAADRGEKYK